MPSRSTALDRDALILEREETRAARQVAQAYNAARRELVDSLLANWTGGQTLAPRDAIDLFRRLGLASRIDARLHELERQLGVVLRGVVTNQAERALEILSAQIALLPAELRPNLDAFTAIDEPLIERFVPAALTDLRAITGANTAALTGAFQNGLIQGESFPELVRRIMATVPGPDGGAIWRRGQLSAELMARRLTITANNAAKLDTLEQAQRRGTPVRKQAVAVVSSDTTQTCLRVHGQIQDIDKPFILTGEPRFARKMMQPAFHWNCRTSIAMYHPVFERGGLTTVNMRKSAAAELRRRDASG